MKLTQHSRNRLVDTARQWSVSRDYFDPLYNYLVHGYEPGSFWTAVLSNDMFRAIQSSHPSNDIPSLKQALGWINEHFPWDSWGSSDAVAVWLSYTSEQRRRALEARHLIFTEREETFEALRGAARPEPILW